MVFIILALVIGLVYLNAQGKKQEPLYKCLKWALITLIILGALGVIFSMVFISSVFASIPPI